MGKLLETLREVGNEVDSHVHSGWSLFHVFYGAGLTPGWSSIQGADGEEFLQSSGVTTDRSLGFDLWRVSPAGKATVIREFWEDTPDFRLTPRALFNPAIMAATLAELVYHADALASRFAAPQRVEFRCEWRGLRGRRLSNPNGIPFSARIAETDVVVTVGQWSIGNLAKAMPEIVVALGGKVARAFNWEGLTPVWVSGVMAERRRFG